jgi:hypothetical protein
MGIGLTETAGRVVNRCHNTAAKSVVYRISRAFSVPAAILVLAAVACCANVYPDYPTRPLAEYPNKTELGDLAVAVEPLDDAGVLKKYFNVKPGGILPVFLTIKNNSAQDTYLFDESAVGLTETTGLDGKHAKKTYAILGSGGLIDMSLTKSETHERENMLKKKIRSRTIPPGSVISGFVYVPVNDDGSRGKLHLQVPLTNVRTRESQIVNIVF